MISLSPPAALLLADAILALHVGVVAFVVLGEALFLTGAWQGWAWVRWLRLRQAHLALMLYVAAQSWLGADCPLTVWEQSLRRLAGQATHTDSFIGYWLSRLIFFDAPNWLFVVVYSLFAGLVLLTWRWVPPTRVQSATA